MGCFRNFPFDDAVNLAQLVHQVDFVMQTPCRINKQHVRAPGLGRFQRVKHNRSGIRPFLVGDYIALGPLAPDFQLGRSSGTEGVPCRHHHFVIKQTEVVGQFADGGRLPHPVDAYHQNYGGAGSDTGPHAVIL